MTYDADRIERIIQGPAFRELEASVVRQEKDAYQARRAALRAELVEAEERRKRELPPLREATLQADAILRRAYAAFHEAAIRQETEENHLNGAVLRLMDALTAYPSQEVIDALAALDTRIELEGNREIPPFTEEACEAHFRGLQDARDRIAALASYPDQEIPGQVKAILAGIPPRPEGPGAPPPEPSFQQKLWQEIKNRGPVHTWAGKPVA
jgi:hypothetical protein